MFALFPVEVAAKILQLPVLANGQKPA